MKFAFLSTLLLSLSTSLFSSCCGGDINSIQDPHFDFDGTPLDTVKFYTPQHPNRVKLYIETSGSMNGFFRANQDNKFKKTVWSVLSGLAHLSDNNVYPLSNGGDIDSPVLLNNFRHHMNAGSFVSNTETHIPDMLSNIISNLDTTNSEVAILISDMKYSPMGKQAAPLISQYQEQIRNLIGYNPNISISFVCAESEFIAKNGTVAEPHSPYYFIIIGKSENVSAIRNDIACWCEATTSYVHSGDMAMNYLTPQLSIGAIKNGFPHSQHPTVITTFDREISDTCSFVIRVNLVGYPWEAVDSNILGSCLSAKTVYGSSVDIELLTDSEHIVDNHHYKGNFERLSYADYIVKLYNLALDAEVIELNFTNKPFDGYFSEKFNRIISAQNENDLSGSFSFNKFIEGCYNGRLNICSEEPVRILVSTENE